MTVRHAQRSMRHSPATKMQASVVARWVVSSLVALAMLAVGGRGAVAQSPEAAAPMSLPIPSPATGAITVVTTTTVFADMVRNVAREHADVVSIIPAGVGPEDYEPRPGDIQLLAAADLIVSNGAGLDDFLQRLLESGTGGATPQVVLGAGIPTLTTDGEPNPHFWLDPTLVAQYYVPAIVGGLSSADPAHAAEYDANGRAYVTQIEALDTRLQAIVATIPVADRKLVTFHDAFPYLARHFGFELVGVILRNVGAEPNAGDLAALVDTVKASGVKAVFGEAQFNPALAQTLAEEAGVTNVVTDLYTDSLGAAPADTYLGMMSFDIERIADALR